MSAAFLTRIAIVIVAIVRGKVRKKTPPDVGVESAEGITR